MSNNRQTEESMAPEEGGFDFHWTDILNYEKIFDFAGIEQGHTTGRPGFFLGICHDVLSYLDNSDICCS